MISTSTDLQVLAIHSPQLNKNLGLALDSKPYFVIIQTLGVTLAQTVLIFHVILSSHSPFPSPSSILIFCLLSPPCFLPLLSGVIWDQHEQDFHIR